VDSLLDNPLHNQSVHSNQSPQNLQTQSAFLRPSLRIASTTSHYSKHVLYYTTNKIVIEFKHYVVDEQTNNSLPEPISLLLNFISYQHLIEARVLNSANFIEFNNSPNVKILKSVRYNPTVSQRTTHLTSKNVNTGLGLLLRSLNKGPKKK